MGDLFLGRRGVGEEELEEAWRIVKPLRKTQRKGFGGRRD